MKAFRNLRLIGAALLLLALIGTAGFHFIEAGHGLTASTWS